MLKRLLALMLLLAASPAAAETLVVHAGRLIADASRPASGPSTVTVVDGRIQSVAAGHQPAPAGARLIDLSNRTVLPGLIDMHVHLSGDPGGDFWREAVEPDEYWTLIGVKNARATVRAGFTTVRDLGSPPLVGFALARGTNEGLIVGPRIIASGPAISIIGGHGDVSGFRPEINEALDVDNTCTGPQECAATVRRLAQLGAQVIKFTATGGVLSQQGRGLEAHFTDEEMRAIVTTAHSLGLRVAAHAHGARGVEAAARAGVDSIEHGTFHDARSIQAMRGSNTAFVPTLMALVGVREGLGRGIYTPVVEAKIRETMELHGRAPRAARAAGVPIVFGTDAGVFPHGRNAEEFALMVRAGMSPAAAIRSATVDAAELLGRSDQIGTITPGKDADIVAVEGDPLTNIRLLENVSFVMKHGRVHKLRGERQLTRVD
ncbi:MAG: amidohydrolase family protein [Pseudomonadota bacterium]|nr:amidohydrolase family protein [Pseudomonadota bacterium]